MHPHGDRSDYDKVYYLSETTLLVSVIILAETRNLTNNIEEKSLDTY